jgi:dethiobiotin synthetase
MTRSFFVTASGTDIGKTYVTAAMIRGLRARGLRVDAVKPVLSGFDPSDAASSDTGVLAAALGRDLSPEMLQLMTPWRYRAALSPDMAAAREGQAIPVREVIAYLRGAGVASAADVLLAEGAGGVLVPLDARTMIRDVVRELGWPAILVGGTCLGSISHTLTALESLRVQCSVAAVVLSESVVSPVPPSETRDAVVRFAGDVPVFVVSRGGAAPDGLLDLVAGAHAQTS